MINFEVLSEWLVLLLGVGTFGIALGAMLYARHCERAYMTTKSPFDLTNIIVGLVGSCLIFFQSPYWFSVLIGIAAILFLFARNWVIIKKPFPVIIMTLLTIGGFINLMWFAIFRLMAYSKK